MERNEFEATNGLQIRFLISVSILEINREFP